MPSSWDEATTQVWLLEQGVDDRIVNDLFTTTTGAELLEMKREDLLKAGIPKLTSNNILKNISFLEKTKIVKIVNAESDDLSTAETHIFDSQGSLNHYLTINEAPSLIDSISLLHISSINLLKSGHVYKLKSLREPSLRKSIKEVIGYQQNEANYFAKKVKTLTNI